MEEAGLQKSRFRMETGMFLMGWVSICNGRINKDEVGVLAKDQV